MNKQEIIENLNSFLSEEFEVEVSDILPEGSIKDTLGLDSLDYVDLVVLIESNFGFKVKSEDLPSIKTFTNLYDYIESKITAKSL